MAGCPQAQCAVLMECGTHAILGANLGPYRASEWEICQPLLEYLKPGMLCLADRGFNGFVYWADASATGAQLPWRCAPNRILPPLTELSDGSYLSTIAPSWVSKAQAQARAITVRVIECAMPGLPDGQPRYRLLTTLLDPQQAPALELELELAAVYHQRWQGVNYLGRPAKVIVVNHVAGRGSVRRTQDPSAQESARAAQQDRRLGSAGVLRMGVGALRGALAATRRGYTTPDTASRFVLCQPPATSATRTGPIRGFSPRRGRCFVGGTSPSCCKKAPGCAPHAHKAGVTPGCSSIAIRRTPRSIRRRRAM